MSKIELMKAAKRHLWAVWSHRYGNDVWGCGVGAGPTGTTEPHVRLYVTREDIKERILRDTPTIDGHPVHVMVESGPSITGSIPGELP